MRAWSHDFVRVASFVEEARCHFREVAPAGVGRHEGGDFVDVAEEGGAAVGVGGLG
jgi:hypothetical protein